MAFINDRVFDNGLTILDTEANRLDICSQEPTTYGQATTGGAYSLGNKTALVVGGLGDRSPSGRKVTVSSFTDGTVTNTGTATHWAISDTVNSRLLATGALSASSSVTSGNTFSLSSFDIGIPDAA
jgi:hypothetical protein